jgi:GH15 family glucan-1,4-alpha-glucosidase
MCWAACDRLSKIARHLKLDDRANYWSKKAKIIRDKILKHAWNCELESFVSTFDGEAVDGVLLLLPQLGFISVDDMRYAKTVDRIEKVLRRGAHMFRYDQADDLGLPSSAFNVCTFWYIEALASLGRTKEARALFEGMLAARNPAGLLSEDIDLATGELWGNFPQTYSMVGLIHCAMRLSKSWEEAF